MTLHKLSATCVCIHSFNKCQCPLYALWPSCEASLFFISFCTTWCAHQNTVSSIWAFTLFFSFLSEPLYFCCSQIAPIKRIGWQCSVPTGTLYPLVSSWLTQSCWSCYSRDPCSLPLNKRTVTHFINYLLPHFCALSLSLVLFLCLFSPFSFFSVTLSPLAATISVTHLHCRRIASNNSLFILFLSLKTQNTWMMEVWVLTCFSCLSLLLFHIQCNPIKSPINGEWNVTPAHVASYGYCVINW